MSDQQFEGFEQPMRNWFSLPNNWTDITSAIDNLAELKVVGYVARHTWGYHEFGITKTITTDEFMHGRKRHDGSRMDKGTGLSKQAVIDGIARAVEHGYLECDVDGSDRARIKKAYKLRMSTTLTPDVYNVDTENRGLERRHPMSTTLTPDVNDLDSRGQGSRQRSEKETLERHLRNTPEKDMVLSSSLSAKSDPSQDVDTKVRIRAPGNQPAHEAPQQAAPPARGNAARSQQPAQRATADPVAPAKKAKTELTEAQKTLARSLKMKIEDRCGVLPTRGPNIAENKTIATLVQRYPESDIDDVVHYLSHCHWKWSKDEHKYQIRGNIILQEIEPTLKLFAEKPHLRDATSPPVTNRTPYQQQPTGIIYPHLPPVPPHPRAQKLAAAGGVR